MKKTAIIGGVLVIMALIALPVLAKGPGGGYGGGYGMGPGMMGRGPGAAGWGLNEEQTKAFQESRQKFFEDTRELRSRIQLKRAELQAAILNPESKQADLLAKNKELQNLTNQMNEKRLLNRLEMRKQFPELGGGYGHGYGMGPGFGGGFCRR